MGNEKTEEQVNTITPMTSDELGEASEYIAALTRWREANPLLAAMMNTIYVRINDLQDALVDD